jgi:hypothetical protein
MPTIYSTTADGYVRDQQSSWDAVHDNATGTAADTDDTFSVSPIAAWCTATGRSTTYYIYRAYLLFDTSGISVAPSAATLKIRGYSNNSGDIIAIEGTWTGASALGTGDFDSFTGYASGWASLNVTQYSSEISSWSTSGYNDITLNAAALAKMVSADVLSIVLMNHTYDYMDATPNLGGRTGCDTEKNGFYFTDYTGTDRDPYIDYTSGGYANDTLGQDMDDEAYKVIGVSSGDISKVSGA